MVYVPEYQPTSCPTGKVEEPRPPESGEFTEVNERHWSLAILYARLADKYESLAACVKAFDEQVAKQKTASIVPE